jgi:hypothetical protein
VRQLQPSGDNTVRPADQAAAGRAEPAEGRARLSRERVCRVDRTKELEQFEERSIDLDALNLVQKVLQ